jgi:hypothetical protein
MELGTWNLEPGTWNLEPGTWNLELGTWNADNLPIYEQGLKEVIEAARGRNLFFSTDVEESLN